MLEHLLEFTMVMIKWQLDLHMPGVRNMIVRILLISPITVPFIN